MIAAGLNIVKYSMSEKPSDAATGDVRPEGIVSDEKVEGSDQNERDGMPSPQQEVSSFATSTLSNFFHACMSTTPQPQFSFYYEKLRL
jgi:hypothetical protein